MLVQDYQGHFMSFYCSKPPPPPNSRVQMKWMCTDTNSVAGTEHTKEGILLHKTFIFDTDTLGGGTP